MVYDCVRGDEVGEFCWGLYSASWANWWVGVGYGVITLCVLGYDLFSHTDGVHHQARAYRGTGTGSFGNAKRPGFSVWFGTQLRLRLF